MSNDGQYICLGCGSDTGYEYTNEDGGAVQSWWWNTYRWGKTGPFHSEECAWSFRQMDQRFSLPEIRAMEKVRGLITPDDTGPTSRATFASAMRRDDSNGEPVKINGAIVWDYTLTYVDVEVQA
jgi:hypothetical protein